MTTEVPAIFWIMIVSALSIVLIAVLYQLYMLLKGLRETVDKSNETIDRANGILDDINYTVDKATGMVDTVEEVLNGVLVPFGKITELFGFIKDLFDRLPFSAGDGSMKKVDETYLEDEYVDEEVLEEVDSTDTVL